MILPFLLVRRIFFRPSAVNRCKRTPVQSACRSFSAEIPCSTSKFRLSLLESLCGSLSPISLLLQVRNFSSILLPKMVHDLVCSVLYLLPIDDLDGIAPFEVQTMGDVDDIKLFNNGDGTYKFACTPLSNGSILLSLFIDSSQVTSLSKSLFTVIPSSPVLALFRLGKFQG